jgi:two-component system C4-dicarboxylate transport sensor histidine kinase DctB
MTETAPHPPEPVRASAAARATRRVPWPAIAAVALCTATSLVAYRASFVRGRDRVARADEQRLDYFASSLQYALEKNEHLPFLIGLERDVRALLRDPGDPALVERVNRYLALVQTRADVATAFAVAARSVARYSRSGSRSRRRAASRADAPDVEDRRAAASQLEASQT